MNTAEDTPPRTPPASLRRQLLIEAGHRCAIPTCRATNSLELAHIVPWNEARRHEFSNMIAICANCHGLFDREKKISRQEMHAYKANLGLLGSRYSETERRILEMFALNPGKPHGSLILPGGLDWMVYYLVLDEIVELRREDLEPPNSTSTTAWPNSWVSLTAKGQELVMRMKDAIVIDPEAEGL